MIQTGRTTVMKTKLRTFFLDYQKMIILTFEVFWILVFLLGRVLRADSVGIPQFIYVNF
jgi:hypothetical protein